MANTRAAAGVYGPAGITFLSILSFTHVFPLYPVLQERFAFTTLMISVVAALSALPQILLGPLVGVALDRRGARAVLMPALSIWVAGAVIQLGGLLTGTLVYPLFLTGRFLQASADAAFFPVALSLVAERYRGSARMGRAMAVLESSASMGGIVGPMLAAAVLRFGVWAPTLLTGLFGLLLTALLSASISSPAPVPAGHGQPAAGSPMRTLQPLLLRPLVLGAFLTGLFTMFTLQGVQTFLGFLLRDRYALGTAEQGVLLSVVPWAMLAGAQLVPVLSRRYSWGRVMSAGLSLSVLLFLVLAAPLAWPVLTAGLLAGGIALGTVLPLGNSALASVSDPGSRGILMSVYSSARFVGSLISPLLLGAFLPSGYVATYLVGGLAAAAIAVLAVSLLRRESTAREPARV